MNPIKILLLLLPITLFAKAPDLEDLAIHKTVAASGQKASEPALGMPGGPSFQALDVITRALQKNPSDAEFLISFGTSSKGSAGHLALSVLDPQSNQELVHSANFYADRAPEHASHYTEKLIAVVPKMEYLFGTKSTLSPKASFGLDFGEVFKRAVIGVRIYGLDAKKRKGILNFYQDLNADFKADLPKTTYHSGRIIYNYMNLNCAKTVALAVKFGLNLSKVEIKGENILSSIPGIRARVAHTPTQTTLHLMEHLAAMGCRFETVLYKKWAHSAVYDQELKKEFKDLPNRFPSVLSLDYLAGETSYESYDNLFAMNLLHNLGRYSISASKEGVLKIEAEGQPMPYAEAVKDAREKAKDKSKNAVRRLARALGIRLTDDNDSSDLYGQ